MDINWADLGRRLRRIKPGWYVLAFLLVYSLSTTIALSRSNAALRDYRTSEVGEEPPPSTRVTTQTPQAATGLWLPVPGASLPQTSAYLPNAPRLYRNGTNQGFDFYDGDAGVPIPYGASVIASAAGTVERADLVYSELSSGAWQQLIDEVSGGGASEEQLDLLRGRQVWIRADNGTLLRYAHLSGIDPDITVGARTYRGQVVGFVGNSGTDDGVNGTRSGARLHYEIWIDGTFFGDGLDEANVRSRAAALFIGP
ncbi:MAG: M23 family metallopeptidase [Trueperaceae bacterium]|nr:M23 family metallopeptidase [Trueperaceae bacterium]